MPKKSGCKPSEERIQGKCYRMAEKKDVKIGDKLKTYSMWTKRYSDKYIVSKKGKGCYGISTVKNGGLTGTRCIGDIFIEAK